MKIKGWVLALIIVGSLLLGGVGGFAAFGGLALAGRLMQNVVSLRAQAQPRVEVQLPGWQQGQQDGRKWQFGQENPFNRGQQGSQGSQDSQDSQSNQDAQLPEGFNAGVSVAAVYGELTGRTEEQVLTAAQEAGTDAWGLAQKEGKLDELKAETLKAVAASLDKMISDGKITAAQKDTYLKKVNTLLEYISQAYTQGGLPSGRSGASQTQPGWQDMPDTNTQPSVKA